MICFNLERCVIRWDINLQVYYVGLACISHRRITFTECRFGKKGSTPFQREFMPSRLMSCLINKTNRSIFSITHNFYVLVHRRGTFSPIVQTTIELDKPKPESLPAIITIVSPTVTAPPSSSVLSPSLSICSVVSVSL